MSSIFEFSTRTIAKIIQRLNIGCSRCGWKEAACDIHHILPRSKGGSNDHKNLTILCPNCHRLAHSGKISEFVSFEDQVGDSWKNVYSPVPELFGQLGRGDIAKVNQSRRKAADDLAKGQLMKLKRSNIDFSKYGWVREVAILLEMKPQKVQNFLLRYDPTFLDKCFRRNK